MRIHSTLFLTFLIILSQSTMASFPEFYGTGPSTSSLGNQSNSQENDPANLYYVPALSAWAKNISISANIAVAKHSFEDINNITTENSTNGQTGTTTITGSANTNYENALSSNIHFLFPLRNENAGSIGLSLFSPVGDFVETNSGSPYLPEYALYRARYRRTQIHFNYAFPINKNIAISLGAHLGFQASARVNTSISLSNNTGSSGSAKTSIKPSLGAIVSATYRSDYSSSSFTFQQEMKSNLEAIATGDISDPPLTLINLGLETMIYYDPHIFRLSHSQRFHSFEVFFTLEYQLWDNYRAPTIKISNLGGTVKASDNFEQLQLKNIFVPKLGLKLFVTEKMKLMAGIAYRQSPFNSNFSGAGNTIDTNVLMYSGGASYDIQLFGKDIQLGASLQYHRLEEKDVIKTLGQENGSDGVKIASPGYKIGGNIIVASTGARISF